jgi:D-alanyl-lipoteichoic acid acyltransferase DltB (MBOAT superfamily)
VLFGLWHEGTWNCILWGAYSGAVLVVYRMIATARRKFEGRIPGEDFAAWLLTFAAVLFGWILFRSRDLQQAGYMMHAVFSPKGYFDFALPEDYYFMTTAIAAGYFAYAGLRRWVVTHPMAERAGTVLTPLYYAAVILLIVIFSSQHSVFVYYRF